MSMNYWLEHVLDAYLRAVAEGRNWQSACAEAERANKGPMESWPKQTWPRRASPTLASTSPGKYTPRHFPRAVQAACVNFREFVSEIRPASPRSGWEFVAAFLAEGLNAVGMLPIHETIQ